MNYLEVRNWRRVQTYRKDRGTPDWIKVKRSLLTSAKWAMLSDAQKGQLISIWLIAAEREGKVPDDGNVIRKVAGLDETPDLAFFIEIGFLEICHNDNQVVTKRLPDDGQVVTEEKKRKEREREREKEGRSSERIWPKAGDDFFKACEASDCLNEALDWFSVLRRKKASMSVLAFSRRLKKLQRLSEREPPADILARSADNGWSDLYERTQKRGGQNGKYETAVQRRQREAREALGDQSGSTT